MATSRRKKVTEKPAAKRKERVTSSFDEIQRILGSGTEVDIVLVTATKKREEVRIHHHQTTRLSKVGRLGFLEYWPPSGLRRTRIFYMDHDTGVERLDQAAALVAAAALESLNLSPSDPAFRYMVSAACRVLNVQDR